VKGSELYSESIFSTNYNYYKFKERGLSMRSKNETIYGVGNTYGGCTHNHRTYSGAERCLKHWRGKDGRGIKVRIFERKVFKKK
jgi:hypothetical protein